MGGGMIVLWVFVIWSVSSLVMTFFSPLLEEAGCGEDDTYFICGFGIFSLPIFIIASIFIGARWAGKKVFK